MLHTMQPTPCDWTCLPLEVLYVIATHTPIRDVLGAMRGTCQRWYTFLSGDLFCRWALQQRLYRAHNPVDCTLPTEDEAPLKRARKYALPRSTLLGPALRLVRRACVHCGLTIETRQHAIHAVRFCGRCSALDPFRMVSHRMALDMGLSEMDLRFTAHVRSRGCKLYQYLHLQRVLHDKYGDEPFTAIDTAKRAMHSRVRNEALRREFQRVREVVNGRLYTMNVNRLEIDRYWLSDQGLHVMLMEGDHRTEQLRCVTSLDAITQAALEYIQLNQSRRLFTL